MKSRGHVAVFGSIGVNIGDDLMCQVICEFLESNLISPRVASTKPFNTYTTYNVQSFNSSLRRIHEWLYPIATSELVIVGGGTLIQNDFKGRLSGILIYSAVAIIVSKLLFRKKVIAFGIGINKTTKINNFIAIAFRLCDRIFVRDEISEQNGKQLGLRRITRIPDIALGFDTTHIDHSKIRDSHRDKRYLCLSLVRENLGNISETIGQSVCEHAKLNNMAVIAICMDARPEEELSIYRSLQKQFSGLVEIFIPQNANEIIPVLANSDINIGMRLHFSVLSLLAKRNPIVLSRESKTQWIKSTFPRVNFIDVFEAEATSLIQNSLTKASKEGTLFSTEDTTKLRQCQTAVHEALKSLLY